MDADVAVMKPNITTTSMGGTTLGLESSQPPPSSSSAPLAIPAVSPAASATAPLSHLMQLSAEDLKQLREEQPHVLELLWSYESTASDLRQRLAAKESELSRSLHAGSEVLQRLREISLHTRDGLQHRHRHHHDGGSPAPPPPPLPPSHEQATRLLQQQHQESEAALQKEHQQIAAARHLLSVVRATLSDIEAATRHILVQVEASDRFAAATSTAYPTNSLAHTSSSSSHPSPGVAGSPLLAELEDVQTRAARLLPTLLHTIPHQLLVLEQFADKAEAAKAAAQRKLEKLQRRNVTATTITAAATAPPPSLPSSSSAAGSHCQQLLEMTVLREAHQVELAGLQRQLAAREGDASTALAELRRVTQSLDRATQKVRALEDSLAEAEAAGVLLRRESAAMAEKVRQASSLSRSIHAPLSASPSVVPSSSSDRELLAKFTTATARIVELENEKAQLKHWGEHLRCSLELLEQKVSMMESSLETQRMRRLERDDDDDEGHCGVGHSQALQDALFQQQQHHQEDEERWERNAAAAAEQHQQLASQLTLSQQGEKAAMAALQRYEAKVIPDLRQSIAQLQSELLSARKAMAAEKHQVHQQRQQQQQQLAYELEVRWQTKVKEADEQRRMRRQQERESTRTSAAVVALPAQRLQMEAEAMQDGVRLGLGTLLSFLHSAMESCGSAIRRDEAGGNSEADGGILKSSTPAYEHSESVAEDGRIIDTFLSTMLHVAEREAREAITSASSSSLLLDSSSHAGGTMAVSQRILVVPSPPPLSMSAADQVQSSLRLLLNHCHLLRVAGAKEAREDGEDVDGSASREHLKQQLLLVREQLAELSNSFQQRQKDREADEDLVLSLLREAAESLSEDGEVEEAQRMLEEANAIQREQQQQHEEKGAAAAAGMFVVPSPSSSSTAAVAVAAAPSVSSLAPLLTSPTLTRCLLQLQQFVRMKQQYWLSRLAELHTVKATNTWLEQRLATADRDRVVVREQLHELLSISSTRSSSSSFAMLTDGGQSGSHHRLPSRPASTPRSIAP